MQSNIHVGSLYDLVPSQSNSHPVPPAMRPHCGSFFSVKEEEEEEEEDGEMRGS